MKMKFWLWILPLLLLTGCWDEQVLKDTNLIIGAGYDVTSDGKIENTISLLPRKSTGGGGKQGGGGGEGGKSQESLILSAVGDTPWYAQTVIERETYEDLSVSKVQMVLIGEKLAKIGIRSVFEIFSTDPLYATITPVAVTSGTAKEAIIHTAKKYPRFASDLMKGMLNKEKRMVVQHENIQSLGRYIVGKGQNFGLPYLQMKEDHLKLTGMALFHRDQMVGILPVESARLAIMFAPRKVKAWYMETKLEEHFQPPWANYVMLSFSNPESKMDVETHGPDPQKIVVHLHSKIEGSAKELPSPHPPVTPEVLKKLQTQLSKQYTEQSKPVLKQLQDANCDFYGVGRYLIAHHPEIWKKLDWEKDFKKIKFDPHVEVEIVNTGVAL